MFDFFFFILSQLFSYEAFQNGEKKEYDHKVDVYSFAIVFWELLTNKTPFKGKNNIFVAYAASKVSKANILFLTSKKSLGIK